MREGPIILHPMTPPSPVVVLGAGAAGLMAAIHAARAGAPVLVLETSADGGRKILISGGGRCNVLPSVVAPGRFTSDSSPHLVRRLLTSWPLDAQRRFFEDDLDLPLALEAETGKLFPVSNRARDVRDGLVSMARRAGATLRFNARAAAVTPSANGFEIRLQDGSPVAATSVIVATGGLSVPATGSDGLGLALARQLGHVVNPTYPALTPLTAEPPVHAGLAGLSLEVTLRVPLPKEAGSSKRRTAEATGGFLFTHRGYSGPAVLDISHHAVRSREGGGPRQPVLVQWCALDAEAWNERLQARSAAGVLGVLRDHLPARLAEQLLRESGVEEGRQLAQLRREERRALVERLTRYPLPWTGDEGYKKAEVTGGGVALGEVDPTTLESRRVPGLYFAGEVLDAFGPIGGHNFAWAWATGRLAGEGAGTRAGRAR